MRQIIVILVLCILLVGFIPVSTATNETVRSSNITDDGDQNETQTNITQPSDNPDETAERQGVSENIICEDLDSSNPQITPLGELVNTLLYLIVSLGALVAVTFGAGFTMMSAIYPQDGEYVEKRNKAIIFGTGTIIVVYGANAIVSRLHYSLDFGCALPFL